jgi:hypothetical protein
MKNIHLVPTDKPSRVYNILGSKIIGITSNDPFYTENFGGGTQNRHIHITSDEEIKEGDWRCDIELNRIEKGKETGTFKNWKKIILTTDQDLIKDGVQAIDDEFLEWFVYNSSCEYIEFESLNVGNNKLGYIICKPQEEPKTNLEKLPFPELVKEFVEYYENVPLTEESKQETLEEAAEDIYNEFPLRSESLNELAKENFIKGAKWQEKRMYSEEEVENIIQKLMNDVHSGDLCYGDNVIDFKMSPRKWFKQHKKK